MVRLRAGWHSSRQRSGHLLLTAADSEAALEERLARHRNLGKAFEENPTRRKMQWWSCKGARLGAELRPGPTELRAGLLGMGQTEGHG
jgi:hypothetical protein